MVLLLLLWGDLLELNFLFVSFAWGCWSSKGLYLLTRHESRWPHAVRSHLVCDCGPLCLPGDPSRRSALQRAGMPPPSPPLSPHHPPPADFLLINPGEWQGWHSLSRRLWEAPGIPPSSKHLPASQAAASLGPLIPHHHHHPMCSSQHMKLSRPVRPRRTFYERTLREVRTELWYPPHPAQKNQRKTGLSELARQITGKYLAALRFSFFFSIPFP